MSEPDARPRTRAEIRKGHLALCGAMLLSYVYAVAIVAWSVFSAEIVSPLIGAGVLVLWAIPFAYLIRSFTRNRDERLAELTRAELAGESPFESPDPARGFEATGPS